MSQIRLRPCEQDCNRTQESRLVKGISEILEQLIELAEGLDIKDSLFHSQKVPSITLENYMSRIVRYTKCSEECLVIAFIYLSRIQELNQELQLNRQSAHRLLFIAIVLAIKYQDDDIFKNDYYAKVGGITMWELNDMEEVFLELLDYKLFVQQDLYYLNLKKIKQSSRK
ncbi:unnamed protein product (macronuclear) [Paramecium tetraurelia]|uniref:Cyclin n=1 Tax=Paramecium tetraurelia TaxID=5888 RepID=A0C1K2_PARTE|nr:uncharacterized protein GSPATT00034146001 [Paramecium tetraurelia]CAK64669.1 unnamed protein product [Paramecium tetraurelia]|eukprot:XP_001432066.1 hypothetical protein (macronuclear) [Paramecium tetraurelia strain d4-2]